MPSKTSARSRRRLRTRSPALDGSARERFRVRRRVQRRRAAARPQARGCTGLVPSSALRALARPRGAVPLAGIDPASGAQAHSPLLSQGAEDRQRGGAHRSSVGSVGGSAHPGEDARLCLRPRTPPVARQRSAALARPSSTQRGVAGSYAGYFSMCRSSHSRSPFLRTDKSWGRIGWIES
jgi:hypothetical protein